MALNYIYLHSLHYRPTQTLHIIFPIIAMNKKHLTTYRIEQWASVTLYSPYRFGQTQTVSLLLYLLLLCNMLSLLGEDRRMHVCPKAATAKKEGNLGVKSGLIGQFEYDHHDLSHFGGHCFAISFIATLSDLPFSQLIICLVFL